jgi:hypothetical protein
MGRPFSQTLNFDILEVLVLVENGGATPREVADSLGMDLEETKDLFYDLMRRGLLTCYDESTTFALTPWPSAFRTMKPSAPRPSRRLSLGRGPKTKAEAGGRQALPHRRQAAGSGGHPAPFAEAPHPGWGGGEAGELHDPEPSWSHPSARLFSAPEVRSQANGLHPSAPAW